MGRFLQEDPIGTKDDVNLYRYVANNPMKYVDRMGLEKILIILGVDKDGIIPQIDKDGNIIGPLDTGIESLYETLRMTLKQRGESSIAIRMVTNFQEFDNAINEKSRETTYFIGHGSEDSILIDSSKKRDTTSVINSRTLGSDSQTLGQKVNLSNTELYILSCNTGNKGILNLIDPIAQDIQNHYGFEATYAPDNYIWGDGAITDIDWVIEDWKLKQVQGDNGGGFNKFLTK